MINDLQTRAEIVKLARVLATAEDRLEFLAKADPLAVRELRERVSKSLFDEHKPVFQRVAMASKLMPVAIIAKISQAVFGATLSARVTGLMAPDRAIEVGERLPADFMADLSIQLDPSTAAELLHRMPSPIVVAVSRELVKRREFITMARFVDQLSDAAIKAVIDDTRDDESLLRSACYVESTKRLDEIIKLLSPSRLKGLVAAGVNGTPELQVAGLMLMSQVSDTLKGKLGEVALDLGPEALAALITNAEREGASEVITQVLGQMGPAGQAKLKAMGGGVAAKKKAASKK